MKIEDRFLNVTVTFAFFSASHSDSIDSGISRNYWVEILVDSVEGLEQIYVSENDQNFILMSSAKHCMEYGSTPNRIARFQRKICNAGMKGKPHDSRNWKNDMNEMIRKKYPKISRIIKMYKTAVFNLF